MSNGPPYGGGNALLVGVGWNLENMALVKVTISHRITEVSIVETSVSQKVVRL